MGYCVGLWIWALHELWWEFVSLTLYCYLARLMSLLIYARIRPDIISCGSFKRIWFCFRISGFNGDAGSFSSIDSGLNAIICTLSCIVAVVGSSHHRLLVLVGYVGWLQFATCDGSRFWNFSAIGLQQFLVARLQQGNLERCFLGSTTKVLKDTRR